MKKLLAAILIATLAFTTACAKKPVEAETTSTTDREGKSIVLPQSIEKIVSIGPSNTEILISLGLSDKIVAVDTYSSDTVGLQPDLPAYNILQPDAESLIALKPDLVIVTSMSKSDGVNNFKPLQDVGICVAFIPTADTIDGIKKDISFIADITGTTEVSTGIIKKMDEEIEKYRTIGSTITDKKRVYFEISAAPSIVSFGKGVFLDEMLDIIGLENILADQKSWVPISEETIVNANPEIIFTNVAYIDAPVDEIKARNGWDKIQAVENNAVYKISTDPSSLPTQNIILALKEMAHFAYPDKFGE